MFPGFDRCTIAIAGARGQSNEHSVLVAFDPCPADDKIANFDLVLHLWTMIHPDLPAQPGNLRKSRAQICPFDQ